MITLSDLQDELKEYLVNETIANRIPKWTEWVLNKMVSMFDYPFNYKEGLFTTASGVKSYFLNERVNKDRIDAMFDITNDREIFKKDLDWIRRTDIASDDQGDPNFYAYENESEVSALFTASTLSAVSSNASDVGQKVYAKFTVSGVTRYEELSLNGTSTVTGSLTVDANSIENLNLSSQCAGVVTVTVGSTTVVSIAPGQLRVRCPKIRLHRIPGSTLSCSYLYYKKHLRPSRASEIIDIPDEGMNALIKGILGWGDLNNGDRDFMQASRAEFQEEAKQLYIESNRRLNQPLMKCANRHQDSLVFRLPQTIGTPVTG